MLKAKPTQRPTKFVSSSAAPTSDIPAQHLEDGFAQPEQQHEDDEQEKTAPQPPNADAEQQPGQKATMGNESFARIRRQRKQAAKRKKALTVIMGVGQMLGHARRKFATEEGELDVCFFWVFIYFIIHLRLKKTHMGILQLAAWS